MGVVQPHVVYFDVVDHIPIVAAQGWKPYASASGLSPPNRPSGQGAWSRCYAGAVAGAMILFQMFRTVTERNRAEHRAESRVTILSRSIPGNVPCVAAKLRPLLINCLAYILWGISYSTDIR